MNKITLGVVLSLYTSYIMFICLQSPLEKNYYKLIRDTYYLGCVSIANNEQFPKCHELASSYQKSMQELLGDL